MLTPHLPTPHLPTLFVADLHLSARRPATADLFLRFLAGPARDAAALYILGDLFDYWAGDDDLADPFSRRICGALAALGAPKFFLPGNRDFLAGSGFADAAGLMPIADETVADIAGTPTLLLHGDTLCTDDREYQAFRGKVRSEAWRRDFLARPLAQRKAEVEVLRSRSEREKRIKPMALMDACEAAVLDAFRRHGATCMIHGHTHRQARHEHDVDGRACTRWVLGDWDHGDGGNALACDAAGCRWLAFPPDGQSLSGISLE